MKFLETKPQGKTMNIDHYNLYYTDIQNTNEKEEQELDKYDNKFSFLYDKFMPNYDIGIKPREAVIR